MSLYYQDDFVELHHGDCRAVRGWTRADVLITDPPYGVAMRSGQMGGTRQDAILGDADVESRDQALELWGDRSALVFGSWKQPRPPKVRQLLIWHKTATKPGWRTAAWFPSHEEIYVLGDGWRGTPEGTVYVTATPQDGASGLVARTGHPTPKPVGLMERLIAHAPEGVVADPFAGSGATLIAARNVGRRAIGVEIDERYCEIIARRLTQQAFDFSEFDGGDAA